MKVYVVFQKEPFIVKLIKCFKEEVDAKKFCEKNYWYFYKEIEVEE